MKLGRVTAVVLGLETTVLITESRIRVRIPLPNLSWLVGEEIELSNETNHVLLNGKAIAAVTSGSVDCFAYSKELQHARESR